jgi:signal transduction histidine kinase
MLVARSRDDIQTVARAGEDERQLVETGRLASIGALATGVVHEFNNPLFAILGFTEFLLLDSEPGTKNHERLELIRGTALELKELVRVLLAYARDRSEERTTVSLGDVAAQAVGLMRATSAAKQVEIEARCADGVHVDASAAQLKQVFVHLISHAKRAVEDTGGTIAVEVGQEPSEAWAEVRHTGTDAEPTSLALSISALIAAAHGGTLTHEGSRLRLWLPLAVS